MKSGQVLVINNSSFDCSAEPRFGSEKDVQKLQKLFSERLQMSVYREPFINDRSSVSVLL